MINLYIMHTWSSFDAITDFDVDNMREANNPSLTETKYCTVKGKELYLLGLSCMWVFVVSNGWVITAAKSPDIRPLQKLMLGIKVGET